MNENIPRYEELERQVRELYEEMLVAKPEGVTIDEVVREVGRRGYYDGITGEMMAAGVAVGLGALEEGPDEAREFLFRRIEAHLQRFGRDELDDTEWLDPDIRRDFLSWERKNPFPTAS
jgi:hypothetical protein